MRALCLFAAVSTAFVLTTACAPRVSKRAPAPHPSYAWMVKTPEPVVTPVAEPVAVAVQEQPAAEPAQPAPEPARETTQVAYVAKSAPPAKPAPAAAAEEEEAPEGEEPVATASKAKTSFYSFTDSEVNQLRKRSSEFRKMHDKLKVCASKSQKEIQRREQVREDIIRLQNEEYRTPKQEKQLIQLRLEERKLKQKRGEDSGECSKMEDRLAEMLRNHYGTGDSAGARN